MTCSFMVSATNSATTVHMFEKIQKGDQLSLEFPPNLITPVPYRCDQVVLVR